MLKVIRTIGSVPFIILLSSLSVFGYEDHGNFQTCPCFYNVSIDTLSEEESNEAKRTHFLAGLQVEGSTILAPMAGFEFDISDRWSMRNTSTLAFHYYYKSISYEFIEKIRFNFKIWPWISITSGPGFAYIFNPKYINNPADPRFSGCGMIKCPTTSLLGTIDIGFQFTPLKKVPLQLNTLYSIYSYGIIGPTFPLKYELLGTVLTIELNYKFL